MKYCLKCGQIYSESYYEYEREKCINERFPLIEDPEMTEEKFLQLSEEEKDAYELRMLELCRQSEFFDERKYARETKPNNYYHAFRFDKYEQITGKKAWTKENELYHDMKAREELNEAIYGSTVYEDKKKPRPQPEDKGCLHLILVLIIVIIIVKLFFIAVSYKNIFLYILSIAVAIGGQMLLALWFPNFIADNEKKHKASISNGKCIDDIFHIIEYPEITEEKDDYE